VRSPRALLRGISLRTRIVLTFVVTAGVLAAVVSASTYAAVRSTLLHQRVNSGTRQTVFALVFAREFLQDDAGQAQRVVSLLRTREGFDAMITTPDSFFATTLSITPEAIPTGLPAAVGKEQVAYSFASTSATGAAVVFGAPLPPEGFDLYLFYSLADVERTLSLLARVLAIVSGVVVLVVILVARRLSSRVLHPLAAVDSAARRVAEGLLGTRVQTEGDDEVSSLAASFNQMASALQTRIQRERRFVAAVSHELRTPLTTLQASTEVLEGHRSELSETGREALGLVTEDVEGLTRLVEELLELSELESGTSVVEREPVDLRALASALVRRRRYDAAVEGPRVVVRSDKSRLERIVGNLLDNAYAHGEGREVRIYTARSDGTGSIAVSDAGPGVPPGSLPHIYDRFYKADLARSRERGGIGLGLAIALQNARLLGGGIEVSTTPGGGATFTVSVPEAGSEGGAAP
jgi:two-component system sensor histidine kinase MtrB